MRWSVRTRAPKRTRAPPRRIWQKWKKRRPRWRGVHACISRNGDDPLISGIQWVAELIRIAGGDDVFPERAAQSLARGRILADPAEVVERAPDLILGSWCGKKFRPERVAARAGWDAIPAVRDGELHEIKSPIILQPGPAALFDGLDAIHRVIAAWSLRQSETARSS